MSIEDELEAIAKAKRGAKPLGNPDDLPDGFHIEGRTTLYGPEGEPKLQWVRDKKTKRQQLEDLREWILEWAEPIRGIVDPTPSPQHDTDDLRVVFPWGDPHIGMYSWHEETGDDFDLEIAERLLGDSFARLVELAPAAGCGHIINLGDFYHSDNAQNRTARSGNALDVDGRFLKVQRVGIHIMRTAIDLALTKFPRVIVTNAIGNHDDHTSQTLALCLAMMYEAEPRVEIDTTASKFAYYRFGGALYGVTHGDTCKARDLESIMAADRAKDWGETRHRHWYTGHVHHDSAKEFRGCTVETFRTMAGKDAWHHASGYRSDRDMKADIWHAKHGRINRHIVGIDQVSG